MRKTYLLLTFFMFSMVFLSNINKVSAQYLYYITADFSDGLCLPVNVETKLSATIRKIDGTFTSSYVKVEIKVSWEYSSKTFYSEPNTGKVYFSVKPPRSSQSEQITFSSPSGEFASLTVNVKCVPGVIVEGLHDKVQFIDPLTNKDIVLRLRAKETEADSVIFSPTKWEIVRINVPYNAPSSTSLIQFTPIQVETGVYEFPFNVNNDFTGTYTITVKAYYMSYVSLESEFTVDLRTPVVATKYIFQTGETITVIPGINAGIGIEVAYGCGYFDIEFTDARLNPITIRVADIDIEIESPTGMIFSRRNGYVNVEQLTANTIRVYFHLVESWYQIRLIGQAFVGTYPIPLTENGLKVATVTSGFDIWKFITTPYILVPVSIVIVLMLIRMIRKHEEI
ncbi:MAG: hypothetical protein ACKD6O_07960 [Candidatus Bathyarchaeota archaeon]